MRSSTYVFLILTVLSSVGCSSSKILIQDEIQAASLFLRNIETGRLYGPFSGEETPPGGTELQVLLMPLAPEPVVELWDLISKQDWEVCERAQTGVSSRAYRGGVYPRKDRFLFDFNERYRREMGRPTVD